jgi:oligopeptide transport system substrate-binding protein
VRKSIRFLSLILAAALVLSLVVGMVGAQEEGKKIIVDAGRALGESDVPTLDPSLATDTSSIQVLIEITPGLSRTHEVTLATEPGMATWTVSDDGLVYTFSLLQGVSWVKYDAEAGEVVQVLDDAGNPRMVTAADFAYGIGRSISNAESYYGGIMAGWVQNGLAVYNGEMDLSELGVKVIDDYTLEITAAQPAAFLPSIFGMWQAYAQPSWNVEANGDFAFSGENIEAYGPFALKEWNSGENVVLIKNPFWAGTDTIPAARIDEVDLVILPASSSMANFEAGSADLAPAPLPDLDRIRADEGLAPLLYVGNYGCTYAYAFNTAKAPLDDARVRQALSMTINRQSLIDNVLKGGQTPAYFWSREGLLAAAPLAADYPDFVLGEDAEAAKALLDAYMADNGYASTADMPPITLMHNESEGHARIAQAMQQMWADALDVNVEIQTQEWGTYLETIKGADAPHLFRYAWCLDYTDAHNFLFDVFHSSVRELGINWDNDNAARFDELVMQAMLEPDMQARTDLYAEAEYLLNTVDTALAPIYFYTTLSMTQPWVERTYSQFGQDYFEKWDVDMSAKAG